MDSPSKRSREERDEEVPAAIDPVEFEWSAAETSKRPHLSIQEASKLMALSSDMLELGTAGTARINWAADAVFRNEHLFRKICTLGQLSPIVHMSLKRAFPRQYAKAYPTMNIFQWVWNDLLAKMVQCVPWPTNEEKKTAGEVFFEGFSSKTRHAFPHVSGGILLEILQGENYTRPESPHTPKRDLDIFCSLAGTYDKATHEWLTKFSDRVRRATNSMQIHYAFTETAPEATYATMNAGSIFSQHKLDFGSYEQSAAGFGSICFTLISPTISVSTFIKDYFDLDFCKNYLTGAKLVVKQPGALLHKAHFFHDWTWNVNIFGGNHTRNIMHVAKRMLKYAERGYTITTAHRSRSYVAAVIYQHMNAMDRPSPSERKVDAHQWLCSGRAAALDNEKIRKAVDEWVNLEGFLCFLKPSTVVPARAYLKDIEAAHGSGFKSMEEWIKPYAEWLKKLQGTDFSVLEPLLSEKKKSTE